MKNKNDSDLESISLDWSSFSQKYSYFAQYFSINKTPDKSWKPFSIGFFDMKEHKNEEINKTVVLKRFEIQGQPNLNKFNSYLSRLCDMQDFITKPCYMFRILNYTTSPSGHIFVIMKQKSQILKNDLFSLNELELLTIVKEIIKFYDNLRSSKEIFEKFVELNVNPLDVNCMAYYRKLTNNPSKAKLPKYKIKMDLLNFESEQHIQQDNENSIKTYHLPNLAHFIKLFPLEFGLCFRTLLNRIENHLTELNWNLIIGNPLFIQSITDEISWDFWRITSEDRKFMKNEAKMAKTIKKPPSKQKPDMRDLDESKKKTKKPLNPNDKFEEAKENNHNSNKKQEKYNDLNVFEPQKPKQKSAQLAVEDDNLIQLQMNKRKSENMKDPKEIDKKKFELLNRGIAECKKNFKKKINDAEYDYVVGWIYHDFKKYYNMDETKTLLVEIYKNTKGLNLKQIVLDREIFTNEEYEFLNLKKK